MKKWIAALLLLPATAMAGPSDIVTNQRNATGTSSIPRTVAKPPGTQDGIMGYNGSTVLPVHWTIGQGLAIQSGALTALAQSWASINGKPEFSVVATSGAYGDLTGRPSIPPAQVNPDWLSSSGLSQILNKPALSSVASSGAYADLSGKPSIPAAQVQTDWNASAGISAIVNKPSLSAVATTGAYADLSGKPAIPAAQQQSDWSASSGVTAIANKPALASVATSGSYSSLTGIPSTFTPSAHAQAWSTITSPPTTVAGYGITDAATQSALSAGLATKLNTPTGTTSQVVLGDGSLGALPTTTTPTFLGAVTRPLNTAYQVSATRNANVNYGVDVTVTALLLAGTRGTVTLQYADNAAMTTNVVNLVSGTSSVGGVLNVSAIQTVVVSGWIPAGKYVRLVTANTTGTPTFAYGGGNETLF